LMRRMISSIGLSHGCYTFGPSAGLAIASLMLVSACTFFSL
jgi:hypothetical protein